MAIPWPSERASRVGLAEFLVAAATLLLGVALTRQHHPDYTSPAALRVVLGGLAALAVCGLAAYRIVRRREYPWLLGLVAIGLLFYEPLPSPYLIVDRVVMSVRDLLLTGASVYFIARTMRSADELERRIQLESLSWSYSIVLVALIGHALLADLLPPLRGPQVASALIASWLVAWLVASIRYQR
ncbi:MAG: hypothetical protein NDJ94_18795 [Vicinamibacteria bacterium]|nr:hypothetical protein [Vicinamibacteria bacterium]